eukprot:10764554-Alexandrium_andersonii.AAC.1
MPRRALGAVPRTHFSATSQPERLRALARAILFGIFAIPGRKARWRTAKAAWSSWGPRRTPPTPAPAPRPPCPRGRRRTPPARARGASHGPAGA